MKFKKATYRSQRAFTMVEVMFMLMMFTMMTMVFAAIIPTMARASGQSNLYTTVSSIAQSKVTQLQEAGYFNIDSVHLGSTGRNVIDTETTPSLPSNTDGQGVATFTFTNKEALWKYLPGGMLSNGQINTDSSQAPYGTIKIEPAPNMLYIEDASTSNAPVAAMIKATITISWKPPTTPRTNYTIITFIPRATFQ